MDTVHYSPAAATPIPSAEVIARQILRREARRASDARRKVEREGLICAIPPATPGSDIDLLCKAITADPWGSDAAQLMLVDAYQASGESPHRATMFAARRRLLAQVKAVLTSDAGASLRSRIRSRAGCGGSNNVPISLVGQTRRDEPPKCTGDAPETTFRGGGTCRSPGAAIRAGYRVEYHADTRAITVGVSYVAAMIREMMPRKGAAIVTLPLATKRKQASRAI